MDQDDSAATNEPHEDDALDRTVADKPSIDPGRWVKRAVMLLVAIAVGYLLFRISAAFFPRWWAQRVADQVDGRFTAGTLWGLFYGFVFTFVPVLIAFQARRSIFRWTGKIVVVLVALLVAAPNWLTLSVTAGNSNAAHAGERILDVDGPGFRAATLIGVVIGAALALIVSGTGIALKRRKNEVKRLRGERDELRRSARPRDGSD